MSRNLKTCYILIFAFSAISIAWNTLFKFFGGVGLNFVALAGITFTILALALLDKDLMKRIRDLFIICCVFLILELIIYFSFEFCWYSLDSIKGLLVYQNIISFWGMLFFVYTSFRFVFELKNKQIYFVEVLLGNKKFEKKPKKAKEISNGTLEEKPNKTTSHQDHEVEDENIVVETEEE